ncbi:fibronectin type III domain protein [Dictyocaulus viviparus]|uniref:Fibronectin type III domain protein n=1 Tax=Dictyocaulus viviparus TaxID=29172 RepID=A0A0D8XQ58_DICVI|nr:fibronectin type III domain protein [Dictyocaulus viviparus]
MASFLIQKKEQWSYVESMYFTFISILTVGFGDFRPSPNNLWTTLAVVIGGVILTTMCMDVFGRMYLKEIHYLGRKLKSNNPFYLIREAKARRRRAAMAVLLAQLARGMIFAHKDYNELSRKKTKKKRARRTGSHLLPNEKFMFARLPPDPPSDCQVISTSAYSVRIAWAPAFSSESDLTYNIRYRLKHNEDGKIRELKGIKGNAVEIMSVDSCSLYEFRITAVNKYGESKPIYLVQYTEPQLSPQHILATKLNANTIELTWEPPYKRTRDVKVVFPDLRFDWFYMFSATAVFKDGQRSPLSRALFIKTDKLEFHKHCVGQSRTIEVMDSICDRTEDNESTALLKRDYASFAL